MTPVVVDCSAMAAFLLSEREGASFDRLVEEAVSGKVDLVVPSLFWFEIQNVLVHAERAGRIPKGDAERLESLLLALPIRTDSPPNRITLSRIRRWAETHKLTAYDAAYPELAERLGARLIRWMPRCFAYPDYIRGFADDLPIRRSGRYSTVGAPRLGWG